MRWLDGLLAGLAVLFGLCCLLLVATGFSDLPLFPPAAREFILTWAPILCLVGVAVLGLSINIPSERVDHLMPKGITTALIFVGAIFAIGAVVLGIRTLSRPAPLSAAAPVLSTSGSSSENTQLSDSGGVQVQVTFDRSSAVKERALVFQVTMNTHSVELGQFDLAN